MMDSDVSTLHSEHLLMSTEQENEEKETLKENMHPPPRDMNL